MVAKRSLVGPSTRLVIPDDGRDLTVPILELDDDDLDHLVEVAAALQKDRLLTKEASA